MSFTAESLYVLHRLRPKASLQRFVITAVTGLMAIACGTEPTPPTSSDSTPETSSGPKIVTTFLPVHLFTKAVVGDTGQVDILISPGAEVHDYQATPDDAKLLAQADVLVENGLGMEAFLSDLVANAGNSELQQIDASEGIEAMEGEHGHDEHKHDEHGHDEHKHDEHGHGHHHPEGNPHVWLDPVLAQQQVANIRDRLIEIDPSNADSYRSNAQAYIEQLQQLDNEFKEKLAPVQGCNFITFHDAFPYLAQRYGLEQEAIVEIPEESMTPQDIQRIKQITEEHSVKALLTEPGIEDKRIEQISSDLNLSLEAINPLEAGETDPQYYFQVMRSNLEALSRACQNN
ncbi:putative periplasmic solute binding protein for ABC transport system [Crocosphaera subtropica ATCC 51142]|uniref:Periplasmic solute binding protein for ABC transport system n=1 Tax=Crocosphaera subtropica (strain ATCC 51142 / BH68) TaxID=43989 RepID=B1X248_CROS5|nr:zinc ABC transporter substrate-binding protein [Crocosphaera subtropica]ACB54209.1 putative periplasmic solute binding protein for ABC transport system [Crocosphaera subtropica ATCC 51142]